eukprot:67277_1
MADEMERLSELFSMDRHECDQYTYCLVRIWMLDMESKLFGSDSNRRHSVIPIEVIHLCVSYFYVGIYDTLKWFSPSSSSWFIKHFLSFSSLDLDHLSSHLYRIHSFQQKYHQLIRASEHDCYPKYFSTSPIPQLPHNKFIMKVALPEAYSIHRRYRSILIRTTTTKAVDSIKQCVEKLDQSFNKSFDDFVLKVVGEESYIYGNHLMMDFESVRQALWDEDSVQFRLIHIIDTEFQTNVEQEKIINAVWSNYFESLNVSKLYPSLSFAATQSDPCPQRDTVSFYDWEWIYRLKVNQLKNVHCLPRFDVSKIKTVFVSIELWVGDTIMDHFTLNTEQRGPQSNVEWNGWLRPDEKSNKSKIAQLPRESVLCFMIIGVIEESEEKAMEREECLAWCRLPLIDEQNRLRSGQYSFVPWSINQRRDRSGPKRDPEFQRVFRHRGTTAARTDTNDPNECRLFVEFDQFEFDVTAPRYSAPNNQLESETGRRSIINPSEPVRLTTFLHGVTWSDLQCIAKAHTYLDQCPPPETPAHALELLNYEFADTKVRDKAVEWLRDIDDYSLKKILLEAIQCVKYEPYHISKLNTFLVARAIQNPTEIGHYFYWYLRTEITDVKYSERFGLMMEQYLIYAGKHVKNLIEQTLLCNKLKSIQQNILSPRQYEVDRDTTKKMLESELVELNRFLLDNDITLQLPINPKCRIKQFEIGKCRYLNSKKRPLFLIFQTNDALPKTEGVLFKMDDSWGHQEMLVGQVITIMNDLWRESHLDLNCKHPKMLAVNNMTMIEIVEAETMNTIATQFGAHPQGHLFNSKSILQYLQSHNRYDQALRIARERFSRSCAAYCIITYVLGIGDRHADNMMVQQNGHFFHIGCCHFLGNFKSKFGIKRERSPFVFTPQMKYVLDEGHKKSEVYEQFRVWVATAFTILREKSSFWLGLLSLMISRNLPELMDEEDIVFSQQRMHLALGVNEAENLIVKYIDRSLKDRTRLLDTYIHSFRHQ